jgi:cytochrome bd-type quinol oxidase subunit 2
MNKILKHILILICLIGILILPYFVFAQDSPLNKLKTVGGLGGYETPDSETQFAEILGTVVSAFLSLLGIIFIVLIIYAGHNWMVASGNEEKLQKAKATLWRAVIGLIIIIGAWAIWIFVFSNLFSQN